MNYELIKSELWVNLKLIWNELKSGLWIMDGHLHEWTPFVMWKWCSLHLLWTYWYSLRRKKDDENVWATKDLKS